MIRIKFIKNYKQYKKGDIKNFTPNEAFGLIDSGKAIVTKDMTEDDYSTTASMPTAPKRALKPAQTKEK